MKLVLLLFLSLAIASCGSSPPAGYKSYAEILPELQSFDANAAECDQMKLAFEDNPACERAVRQLRAFQLEHRVHFEDGEGDAYFSRLWAARSALHSALAKSLLREEGRSDKLNNTYFDPDWLRGAAND